MQRRRGRIQSISSINTVKALDDSIIRQELDSLNTDDGTDVLSRI